MEKNILYVGLDIHENTIDAAMADGRYKSQVRSYGKINNTPDALDKLLRKLQSGKSEPSVVYEAGPCGYHLPFSIFNVARHARSCLSSVFTRQLPGGNPCSFSLQTCFPNLT
jgi:hypothetical protein